VPKAAGKKMKVLTHRSHYIEPAVVPEFGGEASSAAESRETAPPMHRAEEPAIMSKAPSVELVEMKVDKDKAERSTTEEVTKMPGTLSPSTEATTLRAQKSSAITPRRRTMVNVLDVLETTDSISLAPKGKVAKADKTQPKAETEAGPSVPAETKPVEFEEKATEEKATEQISFEKVATPTPCFGKGTFSGRRTRSSTLCPKLKYPKGALLFNGSGEEDFLYCLPDNKEIFVCREIGRSWKMAFQYYQRMNWLTV
jgi:hypothetical protein